MKIHIKPVIKKTLIIERWHRRMQSFQRTKNIFLKHGFANLYMDIVQLTERYLSKLNRIPWSSYEVKALKNGTWIHGDEIGRASCRERVEMSGGDEHVEKKSG